MSIAATYRDMLNKTIEYMKKKELASGDIFKMPAYDMKLESLIPVIKKEMPLKAHAHRADDIFTAIRIAQEFDLKLTIEHCTDGHLISKELSKYNYPVAIGPTLGHATKYELKNKDFKTPKILQEAGCQVSIITDSPVIPLSHLSLCAQLAVKAGMDRIEALKAITINPAKHLQIDDKVGSIEEGKDADLILADGCILDINTNIIKVFINGEEVQN